MAAVGHLSVVQHHGLQQDTVLLLQFKYKQEEVCQTQLCIKKSRETSTVWYINCIKSPFIMNMGMFVVSLQCLARSMCFYEVATSALLLRGIVSFAALGISLSALGILGPAALGFSTLLPRDSQPCFQNVGLSAWVQVKGCPAWLPRRRTILSLAAQKKVLSLAAQKRAFSLAALIPRASSGTQSLLLSECTSKIDDFRGEFFVFHHFQNLSHP